MRAGVRLKLFTTILALILGAELVSGVYLEQRLRSWFDDFLRTELAGRVEMARDMVELAPSLSPVSVADELADRFGKSSRARITIIREGGQVVGDSQVDVSDLPRMENHAGRPEVALALSTGHGSARRYSSTVDMRMLYVAVPFERPDGRGIVRVAMPLSEVEVAVAQLRFVLLVAGAVGLVLAIFISGLASHLASRPLRSIVRSARQVTERYGSRRFLPVSSDDELGRLAGSFNELVGELELTLQSLGGERDRLETILEGMTEAVIALDPDNRITLINSAARELLALPETAEGQSLPDLVSVPALAEWFERVHQAGRVAEEAELTMPRSREALVRATTLKTTGGMVVVMLDITERRRLEKVRRDFVANVSHELRTPVSVIQANAETLLEGAMSHPKHGPEFLGAILRNAQRLARLVGDLLDLSRIESGHFEFAQQRLVLSTSVQKVVDGLAGLARGKNLSLTSDIAPEVTVQADANALDQILTNLVDNAVKYTPEGGHVHVRAEEALRAGQMWVHIDICDDGPGIEAHHRARIFERFYRADPGRSREMGGTGLGLSIVKHLVGAMGGEVAVTPGPRGGSVFRVTLMRGVEPAEGEPESVPLVVPVAS